MVCVDPYLNETTRYADVILPPPRMLQAPHFDFLIQIIMVRNYARFSPAVLPLEPGRPSEAEIMAKLAAIAIGMGPDVPASAVDEMIIGMLIENSPLERADLDGQTGPEAMLDALLKMGPYGLSLKTMLENP